MYYMQLKYRSSNFSFLSFAVEKKNGPAQRRGHKQTATDLKAEEDFSCRHSHHVRKHRGPLLQCA